jgi:PhzF family phenazine biosynthesis protein
MQPDQPATANDGSLYRLSAFADGEKGGNPAGVWIGDSLPDPATMLAIAKQLGYSETAFVAPRTGSERVVRYYSPLAEVSFCGHATIATGILLGRFQGEGSYQLSTAVGPVAVSARHRGDCLEASLTSVLPQHEPVSDELLAGALGTLAWTTDDLNPAIPPAKAYAGAWHLVLVARDESRLETLEYDFEALQELMLAHDLTTLQLLWRDGENLFHSRNPFPVGGVVEDPATGASAAAFGGYLRDAGLATAPFRFTIRQGEAMGRPSVLVVTVPVEGGITVSGTAIDL